MITVKNITSNVIVINYDADDVSKIEEFTAGSSYDIHETESIQTSKGCADLIQLVLSENFELKFDGFFVEKNLASEYVIEAHKIEISKKSVFQQVTERDKLFEGLAGGFLYVKNCSIG